MKLLYRIGAVCGLAVAALFWQTLPWWGTALALVAAAWCAALARRRRPAPPHGGADACDAASFENFDWFDRNDYADAGDPFDAGSFDD